MLSPPQSFTLALHCLHWLEMSWTHFSYPPSESLTVDPRFTDEETKDSNLSNNRDGSMCPHPDGMNRNCTPVTDSKNPLLLPLGLA